MSGGGGAGGQGGSRRTAAAAGWHLETRTTRVGKAVDLTRGEPASPPLIFSSGYAQPDTAAIDAIFAGEREGYVYSRYGNPTVAAFEAAVADLEGADACAAYASGMAAVAGAFAALELGPGAKVVASSEIYGSCVTWLEDSAATRGWELTLVDGDSRGARGSGGAARGSGGAAEGSSEAVDGPSQTAGDPTGETPSRNEGRGGSHDLAGGSAALVEEVVRSAPDVVYCEILSNPLVRLVDLDALSDACREGGAALVVDATFTPPPLIRALEHGATLVLHSATKYLGGHGDLTAGVVSGPADLIGAARDRRKLDGNIVDPFTAWLAIRGLRTLAVRLERQCENAVRVARFLLDHPRVARVHYPGLGHRDTDAEREVLARLFPHGRRGAMLAFDIADAGAEEAGRFLDALELWVRATTLGDLESLTLIPALTSHRPLSPERRSALGITDATVRLSVGIEHADDLIADLERALAACR